jgi:hypothetical protein
VTNPPLYDVDALLHEKLEKRRDLLLLLSLLVVILLHPVLDHGAFRRTLMGFLTYVPLVLATIKMSERKGWIWPFVILISGSVICFIADTIFPGNFFRVTLWILTTGAVGLSVVGLFSYLQRSRTVTAGQLCTAASIYLLLGLLWFAMYQAIAAIHPDAFLQTPSAGTISPNDLLYFSLATLTTLGYGDILPVRGEVRILAALEAATGVLYVAITVALLVSAYKPSPEE